jgi:hypothetical protein
MTGSTQRNKNVEGVNLMGINTPSSHIGFSRHMVVTRLEVVENVEKVCVFCTLVTTQYYCGYCQSYKGLMTIGEWETYTGEKWIDDNEVIHS